MKLNDITENFENKENRKRKNGFKIFAFAFTGFAFGLGYVALNPDTRYQFESIIPQSKSIFDLIDDLLGFKKKGKVSIDSVINVQNYSSKKESKDESNKNPPIEISSIQKTQQTLSSIEDITLKKEKNLNEIETKTENSEMSLKKSLKKIELQEEATIDGITKKLEFLNASLKSKCLEALISSAVAIKSLNEYREALCYALDENKNDENKDIQWRKVTEFFDKQSIDVNEANQKFSIAKKCVEDLDTFLIEVKSSDLNKKINNLLGIQIDLIDNYKLINEEQVKLSESIIHANVLRSYTNEQKLARNQFLQEMQALQPEGIHGFQKSEDQLSYEEINSLLVHAHKRVIQLQEQMRKIQQNQNKLLKEALEEQRKQNFELLKKNEETLLDLKKREFSLEKDKIIEIEKHKAFEELKKELSRQSAAHNNHLNQMLRIQNEELSLIFEKKLFIENEKIRNQFFLQVSDALGRIKGIDIALNARINLELQANNAKQLWLAIQNLIEILNLPVTESTNLEVVDIKTYIDNIKNSTPENVFIQKIIETVSLDAIKNGIWTEPDLKDRFYKLKRTCNRVALIDERGGSIFKYLISYIQSFFIMHSTIDKSKIHLSNESPLLSNLNFNTFSILDYTQYYLENGNIENAIRMMQQLKGEPYVLAKDWIKEAILLLEIRQTCNLLNTYISSIYIGTNLK